MTLLPQLERELVAAHERRRVRAGRRGRGRLAAARPRRAWLATGLARAVPAAAVAVALGVVAAIVALGGGSTDHGRRTITPAPSAIIFAATAPAGGPPAAASLDRAAATLRRRLRAVLPGVHLTRSGDSLVVAGGPAAQRPVILQLAAPGRLAFFDWEADALTPNGRTVASQLANDDRAALELSQGTDQGPGYPGAGAVSLYAAVSLAARQPAAADPASVSLPGPQYYLFGAPGSGACAKAATERRMAILPQEHCVLAGPAPTVAELDASLPAGVPPSAGRRLRVPQGTVVLQAVDPDPAHPVAADSPSACFYVLRDRPFGGGRDITAPRPSTDPAGRPTVRLGLTAAGAAGFRRATAAISRRGAQVSALGQTENQHLAIALDGHLLEVPYVSFRSYPAGIQTGDVDVDGFTRATARIVSVMLRYGPLTVRLAAR